MQAITAKMSSFYIIIVMLKHNEHYTQLYIAIIATCMTVTYWLINTIRVCIVLNNILNVGDIDYYNLSIIHCCQ